MGVSVTMKYTIAVMLKKGMVDVEGNALEKKLHTLGYAEFTDVRVGTLISFEGPEPTEMNDNTQQQIETMCRTILCNEIIEEYKIVEIEK